MNSSMRPALNQTAMLRKTKLVSPTKPEAETPKNGDLPWYHREAHRLAEELGREQELPQKVEKVVTITPPKPACR